MYLKLKQRSIKDDRCIQNLTKTNNRNWPLKELAHSVHPPLKVINHCLDERNPVVNHFFANTKVRTKNH